MLLAVTTCASHARGATVIYDDELQPGWTSWSWGGEYAFDYTDEVLSGSYSISATAEHFGALSLHSDVPFPEATGVTFWLWGSAESLVVFLHADGDETLESAQIPLADLVESTPDQWAFVAVDFGALSVERWTRINLMNTSEDPVSFLVEEAILLGVDPPAGADPDDDLDAGDADMVPGDDDGDLVEDDLVDDDLEDASDAGEGAPDAPAEADGDEDGDTNERRDDSFCTTSTGRADGPGWLLLAALLVGVARRARRTHGDC